MFSRPGNMLAFAMVSVVLSFLATLWFAQRRLDVVDDEITQVTGNATPSIEVASDARAQLRRVAMRATAYVDHHEDRRTLLADYERLLRLRDTQAALPRFPGEGVLIDQLAAVTPALGESLDAVIAAVDAGDVARARRLLGGVAIASERVDAAFDMIEEFNAAHARDRVQAIRHARDGANRLGSLLGALSVVLAVAATLLVFRALRRHARIAAERDRLLEARASEMETFAYRVAHDLRGPLAGMALKLTTPGVDELPPERLPAVHERLRGRVKHMSSIIDGLLEFARAGSVRRSDEVAPLGPVVDEVIADVQGEAEAAGIAVEVESLPHGAAVACSVGVLSSVLSNLVRNAVKYVLTVERTSRRVTVSATTTASGCVRLCVEDNGPGVARDAQPHIFRPFVRATQGPADGIGLGLATVERLVTAHGGRVGVRSEPGIGSLFWVELPLAPTPRPTDEPLVVLGGGG